MSEQEAGAGGAPVRRSTTRSDNAGSPEGNARRASIRKLDTVVSVLVLSNFAFAQPLLDLLGRHAEFFLAHDSSAFDIALLVLTLTLLAPLSIAFLILLVGRVHRRLGVTLHALVLAALGASLSLQVLKQVRLPGALLIALALALGGAVSAAFYRISNLRALLRIASPLPVVVAALFLVASPVSKVVFPGRLAVARNAPLSRTPPIVMVVFDELPLASLMDERGGIDSRLFPNFARLAKRSTWFRNTTTVHGYSPHAVPAILSGRFPKEGKLPIAGEHPHNLLALLGGDYEVKAVEPITQLCPQQICPRPQQATFDPRRWNALLADVGVVSSHMVLPKDLATRLPPINQRWAGFHDLQALEVTTDAKRHFRFLLDHTDRRTAFEGFVDSLQPPKEPTLYFIHSLLPHEPWRYLPSGQEYPPIEPVPAPGTDGESWGRDEWLVTQAYQRHLLQVAFVDRLLGKLLTQLERARLFDRALVVVTADHGVAFQPGKRIRMPIPDTLGEVAAVPLFVKRPLQRAGTIVDRPLMTVDVLPTIIDLLGLGVKQDTDGVSAFDESRPPRDRTLIVSFRRMLEFDARGREKFASAQRKYKIFKRDGSSIDLFGIGPQSTRDLIGRPVGELGDAPQGWGSVRMDRLEDYERLDPRAAALPALLTGRLVPEPPARPAVLAIALNGRIAASTRTFDRDGTRGSFYAMLPPTALRPGRNRIEVFRVETADRQRILRPVRVVAENDSGGAP